MKYQLGTWIVVIILFAITFLVTLAVKDVMADESIRLVTAYNVGDPKQTDDSPCIDASNTNICEALDNGERRCAANWVKKGTTIHIEGYGYCLVTDRTNRKYGDRVDIAMKLTEKEEALKWGIRKLKVREIK